MSVYVLFAGEFRLDSDITALLEGCGAFIITSSNGTTEKQHQFLLAEEGENKKRLFRLTPENYYCVELMDILKKQGYCTYVRDSNYGIDGLYLGYTFVESNKVNQVAILYSTYLDFTTAPNGVILTVLSYSNENLGVTCKLLEFNPKGSGKLKKQNICIDNTLPDKYCDIFRTKNKDEMLFLKDGKVMFRLLIREA